MKKAEEAMRIRWFQFLLLLASTSLLRAQSRRRNLTEITYRFTNCGSSNHDGPRVNTECGRLYEQINSPIVTDQTLFQFEQQDGQYDGGQGFRLPKNDLYNITIAGARGGEGLCNFEYGLGGVVRIQVELTTDYEYLILVGHRGTSVCDVPDNANNPICQQPRPRNITEAEACEVDWSNWINEMLPEGSNAAHFNGGGGGGGASMMWPRRKNDSEFTNLPIVIAPGGGGASAVLDYDSLKGRLMDLLSNIPFNYPRTGTSEEIYRFHVNAHITRYNLDWSEGARGTRPADDFVITSGSGGGWNSVVGFPLLEVDGKLLSQPNNFAQGGFDCSSNAPSGSRIFIGVNGGYGGGGGGCDSGGAGGGYTGGHVVRNSNTIPGSGGDEGIFNRTELPLARMLGRNHNDDDGYVEIVSSNCECAGQCMVYPEEKQFECLCPNDTLLAEDGRSCYQEKEVAVEEGELISIPDSYNVRELHLTAAIGLLSLSVDVSVEPVRVARRQVGDQPQGEDCLIVLFGDSLKQVMVSESIRGSGTIDTLSVISLDATGNITQSTDPVRLLQSPVTVTTVVLLSYGDCRLANNTIPANISIITPDTDVDFQNRNISAELLNSIARTTTVEPSNDRGIIVGAVVGSTLGVTLLVVLTAVIIGVVYYKVQQRRKITQLHLSEDRHQNNYFLKTESLELNSTYSEYQMTPSRRVPTNIEEPGYETVHIDQSEDGIFQDSAADLVVGSHSSALFQPIHGIKTPSVDFYTYNRQRFHNNVQQWQYPRSKLTYMRELGEGQFGKVLLMEARDIAGYTGNIPVAVKTLTSRDPAVIQKFVEEAELMKKFTHPNIVSLLGFIGQKEGEDSAPLLILEYMQYGDLHGFLVDNRPGPNKPSPLKKLHYYTFAYDVAHGLEFLSQHKYVHRDVAARNCLVGSGLQIKIADFGLARGVNNKDYYRVAGSAVLPVRWMAPESLLLGKFSSASDVWAYGVMIWEILTFGQQALPDMSIQDIVDAAQNERLHHTRPPGSPDDLWELVSDCHQLEVDERPSFTEIITMELFNVMKKRPPLPSSSSLTPILESEQPLLLTNSGQL